MTQTSEGAPVFRRLLRWAIWWLLLALLSYGLLSPQPPKVGAAFLPPFLSFPLSKTIHLGAYALLSALVAWLPATPRQRLALWLVLAAHAAATEYLQQFVEGRSSSFRDVLINWTGLCLGLALVRFRRRRPPS